MTVELSALWLDLTKAEALPLVETKVYTTASNLMMPDSQPDDSSDNIPSTSELSSHFEELTWRDGAELLSEAASVIPLAGPAIKKVLEVSTGTGKYSPEQRLTTLNWKWLLSQVDEIQDKLDILLHKLPEEEQPQPADIAAVIKAVIHASERTADYRKRRLLKNALVNAFNLEQYQAGLTIRLINLIGELEYGDIEILGRINASMKEIANLEQYILSLPTAESENLSSRLEDLSAKVNREHIIQAHLLFREVDLSIGSLFFSHLSILEKLDLAIVFDFDVHEGRRKNMERSDNWQILSSHHENTGHFSSHSYVWPPQITGIGKKLLAFILDDSNSIPVID